VNGSLITSNYRSLLQKCPIKVTIFWKKKVSETQRTRARGSKRDSVSHFISRIDKIIGLFCRILSLLYGSFAKETYVFREPTNRSHPMSHFIMVIECLLKCDDIV